MFSTSTLDYLNIQFDYKILESLTRKYKLQDFNDINVQKFLDNLSVDKSVEVSEIVGGYEAAKSRLDYFT